MSSERTGSGPKTLASPFRLDVGSKTEVSGIARHVRFTLRSRYRQPAPACPFGASSGSQFLVLAAEFIPHGRVADQDDVVLAAACDPRILCRAASELEGSAELRRLRVFQDVLGKDLRSVGLCEGLVAAAAATRPTMFVDPAVYFRLNTCVHHVC